MSQAVGSVKNNQPELLDQCDSFLSFEWNMQSTELIFHFRLGMRGSFLSCAGSAI